MPGVCWALNPQHSQTIFRESIEGPAPHPALQDRLQRGGCNMPATRLLVPGGGAGWLTRCLGEGASGRRGLCQPFRFSVRALKCLPFF